MDEWVEVGRRGRKIKEPGYEQYLGERKKEDSEAVKVYLDLQTVRFSNIHGLSRHEFLESLFKLVSGNNHDEKKYYHKEIVAYGIDGEYNEVYTTLVGWNIKVKTFDKRRLLCGNCKRSKEEKEVREGKKEIKEKLLELEFLKDVGMHALWLTTRTSELQRCIQIVSGDPFINDRMKNALNNKMMRSTNVRLFSGIPDVMKLESMTRNLL